MQRDLSALSSSFDVVVLGGGVLGACAARDAALRGLSVALVERGDFVSGTSSNSLKIVHGGLRHLQHLDVAGMRASVRERSTWLRVAPHLVSPLPVVVPLYRGTLEHLAFAAALGINDALSFDRNRGLPAERQLTAGRVLDRREVLRRIPELTDTAVTGGALFHDALMYSSERLVLSVLRGAAEAGAVLANHAECGGPLVEGGRRAGIRVLDRLGGGEIALRARVVVNATGPAGPALTARLLDAPPPRPAPLSVAWNLMVEGMGHDVAFALLGASSTPTGSGGVGPRRLFLVPWRGRTLIGTGHARFEGDAASFRPLTPDHPLIRSFLDELNQSWPRPAVTPGETLMVHSGLLPAESTPPGAEVRLSRHPTVSEVADGGTPVITATTVKFTTSRRVAEDAVDRACRILGHPVRSRASETPLPGTPSQGVPRLLETARQELSGDLDDDAIVHLVRSHGTGFREVVGWRDEEPDWNQRVIANSPVILAQLLHAAQREMACTAADVLARTELAARANVDASVSRRAQEALDRVSSARRRMPS